MASEFRRRTLLTWSVFGAGLYGANRLFRGEADVAADALKAGRRWHAHPIDAFAVSPDGKMIATGSRPGSDSLSDEKEGVVCWRVSDGLPRWKAKIPGGVDRLDSPFNALTFSPDGGLIGALGRQHQVYSIEVSGSRRVGSQFLSINEQAQRFFYSQDGAQLYLQSTQEPGRLGVVQPARGDLSIASRPISFDDREAIPFRLDERGLHLISGRQYLILPAEGAPITVAEVVPDHAFAVLTTPSRKHAAVLGPGGALALIDVDLGEPQLKTFPTIDSVALAPSGAALGFDHQYPAWQAYGPQGAPLVAGTDGTEQSIAGALPLALSPDGNRAVSIDAGEVSLWEISPQRKQASLGRFEHATSVAFPSENRVVAFGPRVLVFINVAAKEPIKQYRFPEY
ncbi:MAG: hypothetical protein QM723_35865 [Myxococcaceae bacterium]